MDIVIKILLIAVCAVFFAENPEITAWIKTGYSLISKKSLIEIKRGRIKPFDCSYCLAFWVGLIVFLMSGTWDMAPVYAACCSLLASWISKITKP